LLALAGACGAWPLAACVGHTQTPEPDDADRMAAAPTAPPLRLTGSDGREVTLPALLRGHTTAVQLMFTGCSTTCPVQGALFAALAARGGPQRLLSISIDVLGDTPARLAAWQAQFGPAPAHWQTAVASVADVDRLASYLKGASAKPGTHTAQVFVFDAQARLRHRSADAPALGEVVAMLARAERAGDPS